MLQSFYDTLGTALQREIAPAQREHTFARIRALIQGGGQFTVFGASKGGLKLKNLLAQHGGSVALFLDNSPEKHGTRLDGVPVQQPQQTSIEELRARPILIASMYFVPIAKQLRDLGLESFKDFYVPHLFLFEESIMGSGYNGELLAHLDQHWPALQEVADLWADEASKQAFYRYLYLRLHFLTPEHLDEALFKVAPLPQVENAYPGLESPLKEAYRDIKAQDLYRYGPIGANPGDTVIDGGAWLGDTLLYFAEQVGPQGHVYAFEPTETHIKALTKTCATHDLTQNVTLTQAGLWHKQTRLSFADSDDHQGSGSFISESGENAIDVLALDSFLEGRKVDLIKLDIEGSEHNALRGAEQTLKTQQPKLAVCLYHQLQDLHQIPLYLKTLLPNHRFYFHHQGLSPVDAVLFAAKLYD